ncbi:L-amino acid N-acyltransferase YncA [Mucilaginibacter oryzae]|uniref:L-amino acid N-acyltransferase YncA n=1 Tax=Mucilaginibacter oryzae TaxID=468058 RepID=A0A316HDA9_9SPHI|nr:GNAT family N-acetyltransferase [Mucilaginibacter oryzae]PWK78397.1 L-amino acid N-acyltransferase YncA [Mucilaginibacter oryzae]
MTANQITLRDANAADIETIAGLMNDMSYPTSLADMQARMEAIFAHPDYRTLLAIYNNEVVGLAGLQKGLYYEKNGNYLRVLAFVVKETARNLGVGKVLVKAWEDYAAEQGLRTVLINSGNRDDRKVAHLFYHKMGYEIKSSGFVKSL